MYSSSRARLSSWPTAASPRGGSICTRHAAAAQLVERRDLARRDLRRDEPGIVLDADAKHRGGVQDIGRECRDVLAAARSSISTRSMPAASAAIAASASAAPSIRPPRPALPSTSRSEISAVNSSRIASSVASRGQSSAASRHSQSNLSGRAGSSTRPHHCAANTGAGSVADDAEHQGCRKCDGQEESQQSGSDPAACAAAALCRAIAADHRPNGKGTSC